MQTLRLWIVHRVAAALRIPIKVRESFWLGEDRVPTSSAECSG